MTMERKCGRQKIPIQLAYLYPSLLAKVPLSRKIVYPKFEATGSLSNVRSHADSRSSIVLRLSPMYNGHKDILYGVEKEKNNTF